MIGNLEENFESVKRKTKFLVFGESGRAKSFLKDWTAVSLAGENGGAFFCGELFPLPDRKISKGESSDAFANESKSG